MSEVERKRDSPPIPSRPDFAFLLQESGKFEQAKIEGIAALINERMDLVEMEYGRDPLRGRIAAIMTGAIDYARSCALNLKPTRIDEHEDALTVGDITTKRDIELYRRVVEALDSTGMKFVIRGEIEAKMTKVSGSWELKEFTKGEKERKETSFGTSNCSEEKAEWLIGIDPLDGSANEQYGKKSGTMLFCAPYHDEVKMEDLEIGVVADYLPGNRISNEHESQICIGIKGLGARILKGKNIKQLILPDELPELDEVPSARAYTKEIGGWQEKRQDVMSQAVAEALGQRQQRSTDATGPCSTAVATGEFRVCADFRNATKVWDCAATWVIVREVGGLEMRDAFGFSFDKAVLYSRHDDKYAGDGGLNRKPFENYIVARPNDLEQITTVLLGKYLYDIAHYPTFSKDPILRGMMELRPQREEPALFISILSTVLKDYGSVRYQDARALVNRYRSLRRMVYWKAYKDPDDTQKKFIEEELDSEIADIERGVKEFF